MNNKEIIKFEKDNKINLKHLFIYMDEIITSSLNEGNIHFFVTINFQENIKEIKILEKKIKDLEEKLKEIEMISWYNITAEKNKNKNYHIHFLLSIKSIIGYNDVIKNNIKYFLINKFEIDTKVDVCWKFIDIKKAWRYLYKEENLIKNKEINKKNKNEKKLDSKFKNENEEKLDPKFKNENEEKLDIKFKNKKENKKINIIKIKREKENWFKNIDKNINIKFLEKEKYDYLEGVKMQEKNYNEKQIIFLWEYFIYINNIIINNDKIFIKIEESMISYKELGEIDFLYENINSIFLFFKKELPFQFENFDELNFNLKFLKNKNEKINRFKEFTKRKINFNFNILEFKDGIYSILHNKFIRTNKFDKNYKKNLKEILTNKEIFTIKFYNCSFENLKEPKIWLNSIEKVLGLKKRTNKLKDKIANFFNDDNIEWLLVYIAYIFHYSTNELNKKNTLYIWGPSNTGKTTLIINLFINYFGKENIGLISNNKNFEYQHIINKNLLIFDEFDIDKINLENFKKLISKELVLGEKKGKEPQIIKPTPMLISSNYSLEYKLNMYESKESIENRLFVVNFKEKLKENEMVPNINEIIKEEEAKIIIYCNKEYFKKMREGKKKRMDDIKLLEKL